MAGVAYGDGRFDDHDRLGVDGHDVLHDGLYRLGVELVGFNVVVGGGGDDDEVSAGVISIG